MTLPIAPPSPRPAWRTLLLLTLAVVFAHLGLLALAPAGSGEAEPSLAGKFSTRTIVIAPPEPAPAAAPPPPAAKPPPPQPKPKPKPRPRPAPAPAQPPPSPEGHVPPPETPAPDTTGLATPEPAPPETPSPAGEGGGPAAAAPDANGSGTAQAAGGGSTPGATQSMRVPGSVRMAFNVSGMRGPQPIEGGIGELLWMQDGTQYNARLRAKLAFFTLLSQASDGRIGASGIEPDRFADNRRSEIASHFVRDRGEIVFSSKTERTPLQPGAQDLVSLVMQLAGMLAGDPARFPPGTPITMQVVGPRDAEPWTFVVGGEEQVSVMAGEYTARKLIRKARKEHDKQLELWLAPDLGYLPARILQTQPDGVIIDLQLRNVETP